MKAQAISINNYQQNKPSFKALYFSKTVPTLKRNYENQKITEAGLKYVEDTSAKLTQEIKEAIAENPFIQRVAKKFDTFVDYAGTRFNSLFQTFESKTNVYIVSPDQKAMETHVFRAIDKLTPEGARLRLLEDMATDKHIYQDCMHMDYELPAEVIDKANVMIFDTKKKLNIE